MNFSFFVKNHKKLLKIGIEQTYSRANLFFSKKILFLTFFEKKTQFDQFLANFFLNCDTRFSSIFRHFHTKSILPILVVKIVKQL